MESLLREIRTCQVCAEHLPQGPRPIVAASSQSKIIIIGQAPGSRVHESGIPWNDPSGDRLRSWMNIDKTTFYDVSKIALVPMGFCYPGTGSSGDLPPRPECAPLWHHLLLESMPHIQLTLLFGKYAQHYYLKNNTYPSLTETVAHYTEYLPHFLPMPHPSPRNNAWLKKNPWFVRELIPLLRKKVKHILKD